MNRQMLLTVALCASLASLAPAASLAACSVLLSDRFEGNSPTDTSAVLGNIREEFGIPAVGAVLVDSDGLISRGVDGLRVSDGTATVDSGELWHLGSNTKAMTATLYATYVQNGELGFDDTLPSFFPDIEALPAWQSVTIRDLLQHRGGVDPNLNQLPGSDPETVMANRAEWAGTVLTAAPASPIGDFSYSNVGYVLVGAALEAHTGQAWEALMNERLFEPLGMSRCGFGAPPHPENAQGHSQDGTPRPGQDNTPMLGPAGTVHCSLESWGRFLSANLAGPKGESPLLDASLWNELHQLESGYAMGWGAAGWYSRPGIGHDGSNTFWYARALVIPDTDRAYGVTANIVNTAGIAAAAVRLVETDAIPLTSGVAYSFAGCSAGNDEQKYCIDLQTESTLDVAISHAPFGGQLVLQHFDDDGTGLGQTVGGETGVSLNTGLSAGRYVLRVAANPSSSACPPYEIMATRSTP